MAGRSAALRAEHHRVFLATPQLLPRANPVGPEVEGRTFVDDLLPKHLTRKLTIMYAQTQYLFAYALTFSIVVLGLLVVCIPRPRKAAYLTPEQAAKEKKQKAKQKALAKSKKAAAKSKKAAGKKRKKTLKKSKK